ncbi:MAG TPA: hypothetical protein VKR42_10055 [Ktedonobacteraceae bacterium]|nr:hypothetical protein [Ktedonobacteraceae bacterium]
MSMILRNRFLARPPAKKNLIPAVALNQLTTGFVTTLATMQRWLHNTT